MKTIRFQSPEESQAWAICFASQCPRVVEAPGGVSPAVAEKRSKALEAEFARAGDAADAMIRAWRERAYGSPEPLDEEAEVAPPAVARSKPGPSDEWTAGDAAHASEGEDASVDP